MIEVVVSRLGMDSTSQSYVLVLQEKDGTRMLPIWIGQAEAHSIVVHMHGVKHERPFTHDLCKSLILQLGGVLRRVKITRVSGPDQSLILYAGATRERPEETHRS